MPRHYYDPNNIPKSITHKQVKLARSHYLYKYTIIEREGKKPIEILTYFDQKCYYRDKVLVCYNNTGSPIYRRKEFVDNNIKTLIDCELNQPSVYHGKNYTLTIYTEHRNPIITTYHTRKLEYLKEPYVDVYKYVISYFDDLDEERMYFNEFIQ